MKKLLWLMAAFPLSGCLADVLMTTAVTGELQAKQLAAGKKQIEQAKEMTAETQITQAIRLYQAEKGKLPPSLESLVPEFLPSVPTRPDGQPYGYEPSTGQLLEHPSAGQLNAEDWAALDKARAAVQQYGADTTWYPSTLADLVPKYLPALPTTHDGRAFVYDNQTGQVYPPEQATAVPRQASPTYTAPTAEMATGMGVQQQLNSMGQSGVNAAGTRSRQNIDNISTSYGNKQMQAADQLGL